MVGLRAVRPVGLWWSCLPLLLVTFACGGQSSPTTPSRTQSTGAATGTDGGGASATANDCAQLSGPVQNHFNQLGGQTTMMLVVTSAACAWSVQAPDWIRVEPASGVGPATLTVTVAPSDQTRQGTISTARTSATIFQAPQQICTVSLHSDRTTFDESGGRATLQVTTSVPACDWRIFSIEKWIHFDRSTGSGNATVGVQIDPSDRSVSGSILVAHDSPYSQSQVASVYINVVSRVALPMSFSYANCGSIQAGGPTKTVCYVVVTPAQNPASHDVSVSVDLRPVGREADRGLLHETATGQLEFSLDLSVPATVQPGSKTLTFTAHDSEGRTATTTTTIVVLPPG